MDQERKDLEDIILDFLNMIGADLIDILPSLQRGDS